MDYHVHFNDGKDAMLPLEELQRRRKAGQLTGQEFVWREGMANWQALDYVLAIPGISAHRQKASPWLVPAIIAAFLCFVGLITFDGIKGFEAVRKNMPRNGRAGTGNDSERMRVASRPIVFKSTSLTQRQVGRQTQDFGRREYVGAFEKFGPHDQPWYPQARQLLQQWINFATGGEASKIPQLRPDADKLAADPSCDDPMALMVVASINESTPLLERAVKGFETSHYPAYPRFVATAKLASELERDGLTNRGPALDKSAVDLFKQCFSDGSFTEADQPQIAARLLTGWASGLYGRNQDDFIAAAEGAGSHFRWLADVFRGFTETSRAWGAPSQSKSFLESFTQGVTYGEHMGRARTALTAAWKLHPEWPLAPAKMEVVAMGSWRLDECRDWFDRATTAQIDFPDAWANLIWALNLRNGGNYEPLKQLGIAAIDTKRFDTTVPSKFFDCVNQMETSLDEEPGHPIYGRSDLWPQFQRMYEGYIEQSSDPSAANPWREQFAIVAFLAQHYDAARDQLEHLGWQLSATRTGGWGADLSLLPLEAAARTSLLATQVSQAEAFRAQGKLDKAISLYQKMTAPNGDERTALWIQHRLASLSIEQRLESGQWVDFLPTSTNDLNWITFRGAWNVQPDGSVEVRPGRSGGILFSRVRASLGFEIKGDFDVEAAATNGFQACIAAGLPDLRYNWYSVVMKNNSTGGRVYYSRALRPDANQQAAIMDPRHNTFDIRIDRSRKADVSINGAQILSGIAAQGVVRVASDDFLAGIGAGAGKPVRYSHVQIRLR